MSNTRKNSTGSVSAELHTLKVFINERIVEIPFVLQSIPSDRNQRILDVGCTESSLSLHLASIGYRVTGVDMRDFPYVHPNFRFRRADIMNVGFEDESFDVVTCVSTLEHIGLGFYSDNEDSDNADKKAISEIERVLRQEGALILSVPFGRFKKTAQQRIYDLSRLRSLLERFTVREKRFFRNEYTSIPNYWQEIDVHEADNTDSPDGSTNCVCLIKAHKFSHKKEEKS